MMVDCLAPPLPAGRVCGGRLDGVSHLQSNNFLVDFSHMDTKSRSTRACKVAGRRGGAREEKKTEANAMARECASVYVTMTMTILVTEERQNGILPAADPRSPCVIVADVTFVVEFDSAFTLPWCQSQSNGLLAREPNLGGLAADRIRLVSELDYW